MKTILSKLILLFVLSVLIYSCTADDSVPASSKNTTVLKGIDTIGTPGIPIPH